MGPVVGASLYLPGLYLVFQGAILALAMAYQKYAASVLAGNALLRGLGYVKHSMTETAADLCCP